MKSIHPPAASPEIPIGKAPGAPAFAAPPGLRPPERREAEPSGEAACSLALRNLRVVAILIVVAFHAVLPYLSSAKASAAPFDQPPYDWLAFPIVDSQRWFGFDLFTAWQDVYLMSLMFFLSGLFAWPSLARKGIPGFLAGRLLRLGAPFAFGVAVVMPLALYPAYRQLTADPSWIGYGRSYLTLPFWPNGPMWFLGLLLAFTLAAAALYRCAPEGVAWLGRASSRAPPGLCLIGLATVAAAAYVPLALAFTPWRWSELGPFAVQLSRPLLYAVYYVAGLALGAHGVGRGHTAPDGALARRWRVWLLCAVAAQLVWMGLAALTLAYRTPAPLTLQIAADLAFAFAGASGFFFAMAACLRFGAVGWRGFDGLSKNVFGIYVLHYAPLVWLQYGLLDLSLSAFAKAAIVFGGALVLAFAATSAIRSARLGCRLIGEAPRTAGQRAIA